MIEFGQCRLQLITNVSSSGKFRRHVFYCLPEIGQKFHAIFLSRAAQHSYAERDIDRAILYQSNSNTR